MLVCHCHRVNDREIRDAIREGARCTDSVREACDAGGACGGCVPAIERLLATESREHTGSHVLLPVIAAAS